MTHEKLSQPVSMEPVPWKCIDGGQCKHGWWCSETYCQEHCQFRSSAPEPVSMEPVQREHIRYMPAGTKLYTAAQLVQARQQGADEVQPHALKEKLRSAEQRIAELEAERDNLARLAKHDRRLIAEAVRTQTDYLLLVTQDGYKLTKMGKIVAEGNS